MEQSGKGATGGNAGRNMADIFEEAITQINYVVLRWRVFIYVNYQVGGGEGCSCM